MVSLSTFLLLILCNFTHIIVVVVNKYYCTWMVASCWYTQISELCLLFHCCDFYFCVYIYDVWKCWGDHKLKLGLVELEWKWCELLDVSAETPSHVLAAASAFDCWSIFPAPNFERKMRFEGFFCSPNRNRRLSLQKQKKKKNYMEGIVLYSFVWCCSFDSMDLAIKNFRIFIFLFILRYDHTLYFRLARIYHIVQAGLEARVVLLHQPPECWNNRVWAIRSS